MSELDNIGSNDVTENAESSPVAENTSSDVSAEPAANPVEAAPVSKPEPKETPFHEHPRWKELINERNESKNRLQETEKTLKELRSQLETVTKPKADPSAELQERLKGIDPVFAEQFSKQMNALKELDDLKNWKAQFEQQSYVQSALSIVDKMQSELKIDSETHEICKSFVPMGTPINKVGEVYKEAYSRMAKIFEARERAALSKYSTEKKADSKVPTTTKSSGAKTAPSSPKVKLSKDPEEARSQLVKKVRELMRENSDA